MMDVLREISSVRGVGFACIFSRAGELIDRTRDDDAGGLDPAAIAREISLILNVFRLSGHEIGDLDIAYEGSRLLACTAGNAVLLAVCGPQTDPAMLRLVLNVQRSRLQDDRRMQDRAQTRMHFGQMVIVSLDEVSARLLKNVSGLEVSNA